MGRPYSKVVAFYNLCRIGQELDAGVTGFYEIQLAGVPKLV